VASSAKFSQLLPLAQLRKVLQRPYYLPRKWREQKKTCFNIINQGVCGNWHQYQNTFDLGDSIQQHFALKHFVKDLGFGPKLCI
jgi:hypothetical protein